MVFLMCSSVLGGVDCFPDFFKNEDLLYCLFKTNTMSNLTELLSSMDEL